ncbi:MAG: Rpn family recombination-promoting nuclease/putative transposase [Oscillospiraceae bacterium]|nr:Rpn family recombination-promoting nuclease/putative transposase [Oscillospiraceae bacterium]
MGENKTPRNTKDNIYKKVFGEPEIFKEFLDGFIPIEMLKGVRAEDIEDVTPRHLPLFLDSKDSDTVKRIKIAGKEEPLFVISIVEHESEVNYTSSYKMLLYIVLVWHTYIRENDKKYKQETKRGEETRRKPSTAIDFKLPPVLPVVFYDGGTKWTSPTNLIERVHMGDIFAKYTPKFEYELVDLSRYSEKEIAKYGNALSLIFLIDKLRLAEGADISKSVPQNYLERLEKNIPESLLPMISEYIRVFLEHIEAPAEEIERISESIHKRRLNEMFPLVNGYSVKKTRELAKKEERKAMAKEMKKEKEELAKENEKKAFAEKLAIAEKLVKRGLAIEDIAEDTGLSVADIEKETKKAKN